MNNSEKTVSFTVKGVIESIINNHKDKYNSLSYFMLFLVFVFF